MKEREGVRGQESREERERESDPLGVARRGGETVLVLQAAGGVLGAVAAGLVFLPHDLGCLPKSSNTATRE